MLLSFGRLRHEAMVVCHAQQNNQTGFRQWRTEAQGTRPKYGMHLTNMCSRVTTGSLFPSNSQNQNRIFVRGGGGGVWS